MPDWMQVAGAQSPALPHLVVDNHVEYATTESDLVASERCGGCPMGFCMHCIFLSSHGLATPFSTSICLRTIWRWSHSRRWLCCNICFGLAWLLLLASPPQGERSCQRPRNVPHKVWARHQGQCSQVGIGSCSQQVALQSTHWRPFSLPDKQSLLFTALLAGRASGRQQTCHL